MNEVRVHFYIHGETIPHSEKPWRNVPEVGDTVALQTGVYRVLNRHWGTHGATGDQRVALEVEFVAK